MPTLVQREESVGRIEERHVLEIQQGVRYVARVLFVVRVVGRGTQIPTAVTGRTRGVRGIFSLIAAFAFKIDARRLAVRDRLDHFGQRRLARQLDTTFGTGDVGIR